jgi:AmmeMemoRadiSam system protein B
MSRRVEAPVTGPVREPAVAGAFYPGSADRLSALVTELLAAADRLPGVPGLAAAGLPAGLLVPHAGLVYSGVTAAAAWRQVAGQAGDAGGTVGDGIVGDAADGSPPTVVLLGTNHAAAWLDGVGAWPSGGWRTPLGTLGVDDALAASIVALGPPFTVDAGAHDLEHSIEVQLPLLQAVRPHARIVPLAVSCGSGPRAVEAGRRLGELIAARVAAGDRIVLAISTDMAHYPSATACERVTQALLPPILAVDAPALADAEAAIRLSGTRGLVCGMCGIEPAVLGMAAVSAMGALRSTCLATSTSADAGGPADRTVGYLAVRFDR